MSHKRPAEGAFDDSAIPADCPPWYLQKLKGMGEHHRRIVKEKDDEIERLRDSEKELRREWWLNHGCPISALYGDDGEMQCHPCRTDFKRQPVEELRSLVTVRRIERAKKTHRHIEECYSTAGCIMGGGIPS